LTVSATAITQITNLGQDHTAASSSFTDQLETSGRHRSGQLATTSASSPPGLLVSSSGAVSTTGTLSAHTYTISGTDSDGYGDTGSWGYTLTVSATAINQLTPTSGQHHDGRQLIVTDQLETSGGPERSASPLPRPLVRQVSRQLVWRRLDDGTLSRTPTPSRAPTPMATVTPGPGATP